MIFKIVLLISFMVIACSAKKDGQIELKDKKDSNETLSIVDGTKFEVPDVPADLIKIDGRFLDQILLLGYTIDKKIVMPGDRVTVTWYWRCLKKVPEQWEYFTHLLDDTYRTILGFSSRGTTRSVYKPEMWTPGTIIKDVDIINVPENWKSPVLELRTGFWRGSDRLPVTRGPYDEENRMRGPVINVLQNSPTKRAPVSIGETNVLYATKPPIIDGQIAQDEAWAKTTPLKPFVHSVTGMHSRSFTQVRLLWDEKYLYVAMVANDSDIITRFNENGVELWEDDAFLVFLRPFLETEEYYEIQVNPIGRVYDAFYSEYRKKNTDWKSSVKVAVSVEGNINNNETPDKSWSLEMAIPFASIEASKKFIPKKDSVLWINFFRIDKSEKGTEHTAWSPPQRGDFHTLERLGKLKFSK